MLEISSNSSKISISCGAKRIGYGTIRIDGTVADEAIVPSRWSRYG